MAGDVMFQSASVKTYGPDLGPRTLATELVMTMRFTDEL